MTATVGKDAMPYSLLSVATLGFDLVRLPAGRCVADVLLTGLAADDDVLARLASERPGAAADDWRLRAHELAAMAPRFVDRPPAQSPRARHAALVSQLERGTIGSPAQLQSLMREELTSAHRRAPARDPRILADALDVLVDAAVGYWATEVLPPPLRRALTAPFEAAAPSAASDQLVDLGPGARELNTFLAALRTLDEDGRSRWRAAAGRPADHGGWARAMHEACWAAHLSGRIAAVAAAHLYAVRAFLDGGLRPGDGARGVWNAVAGCVQSMATADLLGDAAIAVLQAPWRRGEKYRRAA